MLLIDGYNLLYQTEYEKEEFIEKIELYADKKKKKILLIFDGYTDYDGTFFNQYLTIKYVGDADQEIMRLIEENKNPSAYILVSSDRKLTTFAKKNRIKFIRSDQFNFEIYDSEPDIDEQDIELTKEQAQDLLQEFNGFKQ